MVSYIVGSDSPPLSQPPAESSRFPGNAAMHSDPEKQQSGDLPDQPVGLEVRATEAVPYKNLTNGRNR